MDRWIGAGLGRRMVNGGGGLAGGEDKKGMGRGIG